MAKIIGKRNELKVADLVNNSNDAAPDTPASSSFVASVEANAVKKTTDIVNPETANNSDTSKVAGAVQTRDALLKKLDKNLVTGNKFLITDADGNVGLSTKDSTLIETLDTQINQVDTGIIARVEDLENDSLSFISLRTHNPSGIYKEGEIVQRFGKLYESNGIIDGSETPVDFVVGDGEQEWTSLNSDQIPLSGSAGTPADSTPSTLNPSVTFADIQGKSTSEALMTLHFPAVVPTQVAPVLTRLVPTTLNIGKGDTLATIVLLFTENQGGGINGDYKLTINNGTTITQSSSTFVVSSISECQSIVDDVSFIATVPYDAGPIPIDSYGNPAPSKQIPAGNATVSFTVKPVINTFHGLQPKGENVAGKSASELRTLADTLTQATGTMGSFANVTIPNTSDYYILVPGTMSTVVTISQGFTINGIGTIEGQVQVNDKFGAESSTYTVVKLAGQASTSVIDTVTIS